MSGVAVIAILLTALPWYSGYLQNRSLQQAELGYRVEALHTAESAVSYNPLSIQALFILAGAEQRIGREAEAKRTLLKATGLQRQNYVTWEQLAIYERDHWNEPDKAREYFEKAVSLNPRDSRLREEAGIPED